jgi:hypothetical protein
MYTTDKSNRSFLWKRYTNDVYYGNKLARYDDDEKIILLRVLLGRGVMMIVMMFASNKQSVKKNVMGPESRLDESKILSISPTRSTTGRRNRFGPSLYSL